ncbi:MAG: electron transport complex subunit RsxC [Fibrobacterales bacterium]
MIFKTFKIGGVHPPENKFSAGAPIVVLPTPKQVSIPLSQHIGAPASALVKKGDTVKVGTPIGQAAGFISANIHSSVSGTVAKIEEVAAHNGYKKTAVTIKVSGDDWEENIDRSDTILRDITLSPQEIVARIKSFGIVGLGGACFPSHVKFMIPEGKKADHLVINAVECEPYLTADHRIMLERTEEILIGVEAMKKALQVEKAVIGIEGNKPDAIAIMTELASSFPGTKIVPLKVQYPQGAEKQLIKATVNREVPSGTLPLEVGCVVSNVGSALAIYEAVQKNKPLIDRVVTVTGKNVSNPSNFLTRIGTPMTDLIEAAGGLPENTGKVISGGPMMGGACTNIDAPVVKGTSGITILDESDARRGTVDNCIRCAKCVTVCPMGLEPQLLEKLSAKGFYEEAEKDDITDCIECGSCSYACPSNRPILDYIRLGKGNVMRIRRERS